MGPDQSRAVSRRQFLAGVGIVGATALAGCRENPRLSDSTTGGDSMAGEIVVTGSSTVYPISVAIAEQFDGKYDTVTVSVDSTGTGGGFQNHFCPGNSDINDASRPITGAEREHCANNDVEPFELQVGADALTVVVNPAADWLDCITYEQLREIWKPEGADQWSDVDASWPDENIELYGAASTSGTFDWFSEHVIGEQGRHRQDYEATEDDNRIVQGIAGSEYAMGYFGYRYYEENQDRLKALAIAESADDECTPPSLENAKDGSYPMARPLFIYPDKGSLERRPVREFLRYYVVAAETDVVTDVGYVPTSVEQRNQNLGTLESKIQDVLWPERDFGGQSGGET